MKKNKIASITITYNDGYKFKEWCEHYEGYKDEIDTHIIVDNASEPEYLQQVKNYFTNSIIVERITNGGCTAAYNDGLRLALEDKEINAIMLIGNDMMLKTENLKKLYNFLYSDDRFGMVEPLLLERDSTIYSFGSGISKKLFMLKYMRGKQIKDVDESYHICTTIAGGMNIAKREFYERVGLQDENLFMYSDEVDMGIRAQKKGFLMAATKDAVAWHMHINEKANDRRHPYFKYLIARNKVYLGKKHFGIARAIYIFNYFIFDCLKGFIVNIFRWNIIRLKEYKWQLYGAIAGLTNNMKSNKYSRL